MMMMTTTINHTRTVNTTTTRVRILQRRPTFSQLVLFYGFCVFGLLSCTTTTTDKNVRERDFLYNENGKDFSFAAKSTSDNSAGSSTAAIDNSEEVVPIVLFDNTNDGNNDHPYKEEEKGEEETVNVVVKLELIKLIGEGARCYGFKARFMGEIVFAKIAYDHSLYFLDTELEIFRRLKRPPTIPNIPNVRYAATSIPNPFDAANNKYHHHHGNNSTAAPYVDNGNMIRALNETLGLTKRGAEKLVLKRRVSVIVTDLLRGKREPENLGEFRKFAKSLLETFRFAHSRNVMHCDLHSWNYYWDGELAHVFDWNGGFFYEPNVVLLWYPHATSHLFPPEGWIDRKLDGEVNKTAVHPSVHAFDSFTIGKLFKRKLKKCCGVTWKKLRRVVFAPTPTTASTEEGEEDEAVDDDSDEEEEKKRKVDRTEDEDEADAAAKNNNNNSTSGLTTTLKSNRKKKKKKKRETTASDIDLKQGALAYDLALYLMTRDPTKRPDATMALEHPFFIGKNSTYLRSSTGTNNDASVAVSVHRNE